MIIKIIEVLLLLPVFGTITVGTLALTALSALFVFSVTLINGISFALDWALELMMGCLFWLFEKSAESIQYSISTST
jgi:uncharacterized membrane protein